MKRWFFVVLGALLLGRDAYAVIDPECMGMPKPADYDEQVQQDFLSNYFALVTSMSPIHGPIPHESGHGGLGLDLLGTGARRKGAVFRCRVRVTQHGQWEAHSCGHSVDARTQTCMSGAASVSRPR